MGAFGSGLASQFNPFALFNTVEEGIKDKPATPAEIPDTPSRDSEDVQAEKDRTRARAANRRGKNSTLLTGPDGATTSPGSGRKRVLGK